MKMLLFIKFGSRVCHCFVYKGTYLLKALTCMRCFRYKQKLLLFSRKRKPLAKLLYEQLMHPTYITLHPKIQLLSNPHMLISLFKDTSWFDTTSNIVTCWWTLEKKTVTWTWTTIIPLHYLEVVLPKCRKIYIYNFCLWTLSRSKWKIVNSIRNTYIWVKILLNIVVR